MNQSEERSDPLLDYHPTPAKLRDRLLILWIDYMILTTVSLPVIIIPAAFFLKGYCDDNSNIKLSMFFLAFCAFLILLILCFIATTIVLISNLITILNNGQTLGQKMLRVRLADDTTFFIPSFGKKVMRYIDFVVSIFLVLFGPSFFLFYAIPVYFSFVFIPLFILAFMLFDFLFLLLPGHRSLRDRISKTCVVYVSLNAK